MNARAAGPFTLPQLPWDEGALDPVISARTIGLHYGKHHKAYVDKLNELVAGTPYAEMPLEQVVRQAAADKQTVIRAAVARARARRATARRRS